MIKTTRCLVLVSLTALVAVSSSQAAMLSLVAAGVSPSQSYSNLGMITGTPTVTGSFGIGGGLLFDIPLAMGVGFEFGGLYLPRKIEVNGQTLTPKADDVTSTYHEIQVPVLLKFRLLPMVHIGVGGYWATAMGSIDAEDATTSANSNSSETYSAAGLKSSDYGLLGSFGFSLPLGAGGTHFMVDGRYAYGLENISTGTDTVKNRDVEVLVGLSFPFGKRR
jgi:hypothetical protein